MVYHLRYLIILAFFIWAIIAGVYASKIGPLTEAEEFLPKNHQLKVTSNILSDEFDGQGDDGLIVNIFWGVKDIDKQGGSQWDSFHIGKAILDEQFDLSSEEAQSTMLTFCADLKKQDFVRNGNVNCWIEKFQKWVKLSASKDMPLKPGDFQKYINLFRKTPYGSQLENDQMLGFIGDRLAYFEIKAESIGGKTDTYAQKNPLYQRW